MKEIFNSNCPVMLSFVEHILNAHDIRTQRLNEYTSSLFGNIIDLVPVCIAVRDEDMIDAARILRTEKIVPSCDRPC